jgi:hypothetical protein
MSDKDKLKDKIMNDPDFIYSPKYEFSLKKFVYRHDEGIEDSHAAKVLLMDPEEIEKIYKKAVENLKKIMKG